MDLLAQLAWESGRNGISKSPIHARQIAVGCTNLGRAGLTPYIDIWFYIVYIYNFCFHTEAVQAGIEPALPKVITFGLAAKATGPCGYYTEVSSA